MLLLCRRGELKGRRLEVWEELCDASGDLGCDLAEDIEEWRLESEADERHEEEDDGDERANESVGRVRAEGQRRKKGQEDLQLRELRELVVRVLDEGSVLL